MLDTCGCPTDKESTLRTSEVLMLLLLPTLPASRKNEAPDDPTLDPPKNNAIEMCQTNLLN